MAGHIQDAGSVDWLTPDWILEGVRRVLGGQIDLDPCSNPWSKVAARVQYSLPTADGLEAPWDVFSTDTTVFVNPPFGACYMNSERQVLSAKDFRALPKEDQPNWRRSTIKDWVKKCVECPGQVFLLIPAATETSHFHQLIYPNARAILFPRGRVKYDLPPHITTKHNAPPMGSALIYFGKSIESEIFKFVFKDKGHVEVLR